MKSAEFVSLRAQFPDSDDDLSAELGVPIEKLERWRTGAERIPRFEARLLRFIAAAAIRRRALTESGLPVCDWIAEFAQADPSDDVDEMVADRDRAEEHMKACQRCQARERFVTERFGPMPRYPMRALTTVFEVFVRIPASLRPAAVGAAALAALVLLRAVFALPAIIARPALAFQLLPTVLAAAAAGASGGLAFTLVRPTFRKLGRPGDYLTGIACVGAYLTSLALVAPIVFGEPLFEGAVGWISVGITSILFGLVIGHSWFGPESPPEGSEEHAS